MIYIHNEAITGIEVHDKPIERVYQGTRLVWLRNSQNVQYYNLVGYDGIPVNIGLGKCMSDRIYIGFIISEDVNTSDILSINLYSDSNHTTYGLSGVSDLNNNVPYGSYGLSQLSTITNNPSANKTYWIEYQVNDSSTYIPNSAIKSSDTICTYIKVSTSSYGDLYTTCYVPSEYTDIEGKLATYVFDLTSLADSSVNVGFDTDNSSIITL